MGTTTQQVGSDLDAMATMYYDIVTRFAPEGTAVWEWHPDKREKFLAPQPGMACVSTGRPFALFAHEQLGESTVEKTEATLSTASTCNLNVFAAPWYTQQHADLLKIYLGIHHSDICQTLCNTAPTAGGDASRG